MVSNGVKATSCFASWKLFFFINLLQTPTKIDFGVWMTSAQEKMSKIIFEFLSLFLEVIGLASFFPLAGISCPCRGGRWIISMCSNVPFTEEKCIKYEAINKLLHVLLVPLSSTFFFFFNKLWSYWTSPVLLVCVCVFVYAACCAPCLSALQRNRRLIWNVFRGVTFQAGDVSLSNPPAVDLLLLLIFNSFDGHKGV